MGRTIMKFEDEAKLILEAVTKTATSKRNRERALKLGGRVANEVKSAGFRILSDLAGRMTNPESNPFDLESKPPISKPVSSREYAAQHFSQPTRTKNRGETASQAEPKKEALVEHSNVPAADSEPSGGPEVSTTSEHSSQIPARRYGINRAVLLIRRPDQAFAYWEIDEDRIPEAKRCGLELINNETGLVTDDASVSAQQGKYYFPLTDPDPSYVVELYVETTDGTRVQLSRSKPAKYQQGNPTGSQRPTKAST